MARRTEAPQPCLNCGVMVVDWHEWFTQACPGHWGGHEVADWPGLKFIDDITEAQEAPRPARGKRR